MNQNKIPLSASRIKTLDSCSWDYYCNYLLKLPDQTNSGAVMGSCCHNLYEYLGEEKRKKIFDKLVKHQNVSCCPQVERYINSFLKKEGFPPKDLAKSAHGEEISHFDLVERMFLEGLNYDFFGKDKGEPTESHSEISFDIDVEEGEFSYRVRGFIDKLFLFEDKSLAIIRDFKSSKNKFQGKELEDNIQDQIYRLVVKKLYPKYNKGWMEFVFLQYDCEKHCEEAWTYLVEGDNEYLVGVKSNDGGILVTPEMSEGEMKGLEYYLTDIQKIVDNFDEKLAISNMASEKGWPEKYEGFAGLIKCGRAENPKQKKVNGDKMWHCPMKFGYFYYELKEGDKIVKTSKLKKDLKPLKGQKIEKKFYGGCPAFNNLKYNKDIIAKAKDQGFEVEESQDQDCSKSEARDLW